MLCLSGSAIRSALRKCGLLPSLVEPGLLLKRESDVLRVIEEEACRTDVIEMRCAQETRQGGLANGGGRASAHRTHAHHFHACHGWSRCGTCFHPMPAAGFHFSHPHRHWENCGRSCCGHSGHGSSRRGRGTFRKRGLQLGDLRLQFGKLLGECGITCGSVGRHGACSDVSRLGRVNGRRRDDPLGR